jgi:alpha-N-acetylglucosamine transferase
MKTLKLFAFGIVLFVTSSMQSQVSVNINIGTPPLWGPSVYSNVDYYYLPDVQAYYDIKASQFIYFGGGNWTRSRYLPGQYRNYDLYNGYKVVLNDYHGRTPYSNYKEHKVKYYKGYKGKPQRSIGQRANNNSNYSKGGNGEHQQGNGNNGHGNNGHGKGNINFYLT